MIKFRKGIKNYLNELQTSPVTSKSKSEDINKSANFHGYLLLDPN